MKRPLSWLGVGLSYAALVITVARHEPIPWLSAAIVLGVLGFCCFAGARG